MLAQGSYSLHALISLQEALLVGIAKIGLFCLCFVSMTMRIRILALWAVAAMVLIVACEDDPATPSITPVTDAGFADGGDGPSTTLPDAGMDSVISADATADAIMVTAPDACIVSAPVVFSDADFTSGWTRTKFGEGSATHESVDLGNPPPSMKVTISCDKPPPAAKTTVTAVFIKTSASYDPAVSGPIESIDYQEDYLCGNAYNAPVSGAALEQGGVLFRQVQGLNLGKAAWVTIKAKGLHAGDFKRVNGTEQPNFSPTGAPISFGFFRENTTPGIGCCPITVTAYLDNWSVTANSPVCR